MSAQPRAPRLEPRAPAKKKATPERGKRDTTGMTPPTARMFPPLQVLTKIYGPGASAKEKRPCACAFKQTKPVAWPVYGGVLAVTGRCLSYPLSAVLKSNEAELMQYLRPVGRGPSWKT